LRGENLTWASIANRSRHPVLFSSQRLFYCGRHQGDRS